MITKAQATFLTSIANGEIEYSQLTGAFGSKYTNIVTGKTVAKHNNSQIQKSLSNGWIVGPSIAQRMGGPMEMIIKLSPKGAAALAERTA